LHGYFWQPLFSGIIAKASHAKWVLSWLVPPLKIKTIAGRGGTERKFFALTQRQYYCRRAMKTCWRKKFYVLRLRLKSRTVKKA